MFTLISTSDLQQLYFDRISKYSCSVTDDNYAVFEKNEHMLILMSEIENYSMAVFDLYKKEFIFFRSGIKHKTRTGYDNDNKHLHQFYAQLHPEDIGFVLDTKIKLFNFLTGLPPTERNNYNLVFNFRMKNKEGAYCQYIQRQMVIESDNEGKPWLVMNINNLLSEQSTKLTLQRHLVNLKTGKFHLFNNELEDGATQLFTEREKEVFALIAQGLDSMAIAEKLFISEHTVNNHRRHVLSKTHTANTIQALVYAKLLGII